MMVIDKELVDPYRDVESQKENEKKYGFLADAIFWRYLMIVLLCFFVIMLFVNEQEINVIWYLLVGFSLALTYGFIFVVPKNFTVTEIGLEVQRLFGKKKFISSWDEIISLDTYKTRKSGTAVAAITDSFGLQTSVLIGNYVGIVDADQFVKTIIERAELVHVEGNKKLSSSYTKVSS
jgi:hypothetical protein